MAADHPLVKEHAWISKYANAKGQNCCGPMDTFRLTHEEANALDVGSEVTVRDQHGFSYTIIVNRVYNTEDPKGDPWVTRYGCLFRAQGV